MPIQLKRYTGSARNLHCLGLPDPGSADLVYRLSYLLGPLVTSVPLALAGLAVQLTTKQRRVRVAEVGARAQRVWPGGWWYQVWQAAWLCRRCRVVFFLEGAVGPDFSVWPAIEVAQLPMWVTAVAERVFGVPEPAGLH